MIVMVSGRSMLVRLELPSNAEGPISTTVIPSTVSGIVMLAKLLAHEVTRQVVSVIISYVMLSTIISSVARVCFTASLITLPFSFDTTTRNGTFSFVASATKLNDAVFVPCHTLVSDKFKGFDVPVCNTHSNADAVAELGVAMVLDLLKKVSYHDRKMREGSWNRDEKPLNLKSRMLSRQTVCILGFVCCRF